MSDVINCTYEITWNFETTGDEILDTLTREVFSQKLDVVEALLTSRGAKPQINNEGVRPVIIITGPENRIQETCWTVVRYLSASCVKVSAKSLFAKTVEESAALNKSPPYTKTYFYTTNIPYGVCEYIRLDSTEVSSLSQIYLRLPNTDDVGASPLAGFRKNETTRDMADTIDMIRRIGDFSTVYIPQFDTRLYERDKYITRIIQFKPAGLDNLDPVTLATTSAVCGWSGYLQSPLAKVLEFVRRDVGLPYAVSIVTEATISSSGTCVVSFASTNNETTRLVNRIVDTYSITEGFPRL